MHVGAVPRIRLQMKKDKSTEVFHSTPLRNACDRNVGFANVTGEMLSPIPDSKKIQNIQSDHNYSSELNEMESGDRVIESNELDVEANNPGVNMSSATAELHDKEFIEVEASKKRKRRNRSSGSPKTNPNKKVNMDDPAALNNDEHNTASPPESQTPLISIPEVTLSPELLELERRLNKNMITNIASGIKTALKPLQESIKNIEKSSDLILRQETQIKELTEENTNLLEEVNKVKTELTEFKKRLFNLENKSLECNLIFRGVEEVVNETNESLKERIYWLLADTVDNPNASERLAAAKSLGIYRCRRLGKVNPV